MIQENRTYHGCQNKLSIAKIPRQAILREVNQLGRRSESHAWSQGPRTWVLEKKFGGPTITKRVTVARKWELKDPLRT